MSGLKRPQQHHSSTMKQFCCRSVSKRNISCPYSWIHGYLCVIATHIDRQHAKAIKSNVVSDQVMVQGASGGSMIKVQQAKEDNRMEGQASISGKKSHRFII